MQIDIRTQGFRLTESLNYYAERQLRFALSNCDDLIEKIEMQLSDRNSRRDSSDKCCLLRIIISGLPDIIIEDTQMDILIAIDRATDRGGRTVVRKLKRQQSLLRQGLSAKSKTA